MWRIIGPLTARARSPQRKGRCVQVKPLVLAARGPSRVHSPAFSRPSGVNSDTRRRLRTRRDACGLRQGHLLCLIKTGFARKVGRESRGIERGSSLALGLATHPNTAKTAFIAAAEARRNRDAYRASSAPHSESKHSCCANAAAPTPRPLRSEVSIAAAPDASAAPQRRHCRRATRARGDHGQERKGGGQ